ncbi:MAG TPA: protein-disulfide reductase DsbD domain-containing protein [Vicinamibacterales bacterium]|nr:protein-disulfide reductase DsbD domain-containing protein [Vicinamibacterales bacterium]
MTRHLAAAVFLVLIGFTGASNAVAQSKPAPKTAVAEAPPAAIKNGVTVRAKYLSLLAGTSAAQVSPGGRVTLLVQVAPHPKMHVYAPGQAGYVAVDLSVAPDEAFTAGRPVYPPSQSFVFAPTAETLKVYSKPFVLRQDLVIGSSAAMKRRAAAGDALTVAGSFHYQACDDAVCYRPETVPVNWKIKLKP